MLGSALLYIGSITGWVLMYIHFGHAGCPAQQTVISLTLILCVALTGISCSRVAPHGTLLTSAAVTAFATYLRNLSLITQSRITLSLLTCHCLRLVDKVTSHNR